MQQRPKTEKAIFWFGVILAILSGFLLIQSDSLGKWLGLLSESKYKPIATVDSLTHTAQRKGIDSPDFEVLGVNQSVFNHDTLMTGEDSSLILSLADKSTVALEPNTMIQLEVQNEDGLLRASDLMIDVFRGKVAGNSVLSGIRISELGKERTIDPLPIPKITPVPNPMSTPAPTATATPVPVAVSSASPTPDPTPAEKLAQKVSPTPTVSMTHCRFLSPEVQSPDYKQNFSSQVKISVECGKNELPAVVVHKDQIGSGTRSVSVQSVSNGHYIVRGEFDTPGKYLFEFRSNGSPALATVEIKPNVGELNWTASPIRCDHGVSFRPASDDAVSYALLSENGSVIREDHQSKNTYFSNLDELRLPARVRVKHDLKGGFYLISRVLTISAWKNCPTLKSPQDGTQQRYDPKNDLYFTWNYLSKSDLFLLELAADPEFKTIIYKSKLNQNYKVVRISKRGQIYWRVRELKTGTLSESSKLFIL